MSDDSVSGARAFSAFLIAIVCALSAVLNAGQFKWMIGGDKDVKYETYKDPSGRFELEVPTKDWKVLQAAGASLAIFSRKDGPILSIDRTRMPGRMTPAEVETMADPEVDRLKEQQPKAKDFKSEMLDSKSGRGVLVQYSRASTEPESIIQYSVPVGRDLYRLNGVVADKLITKNRPVVMHMIQSFKAAPDSTTAKH
jgi:hypothetical protein